MSINIRQLIIGVCGVGSATAIALERFVQTGHSFFGITAAVLALISSIFGIVSAAEGVPIPPPPPPNE